MVQAIADGDLHAIDTHRALMDATVGFATRADAMAVYANFSMMTRIADATGTPLDAGSTALSEALRADLGLNNLTSTRF